MFQDYKILHNVVEGNLQVNLPAAGSSSQRYINMTPNAPSAQGTFFTSTLPGLLPAAGAAVSFIWFVRADASKKTRDNLRNVVFSAAGNGWVDDCSSLNATLVRYEGPSLPDSFGALGDFSHHLPIDLHRDIHNTSTAGTFNSTFYCEGAASLNAYPEIDSNNVWFGIVLRMRAIPTAFEVMLSLRMALEERIPYQQLKG